MIRIAICDDELKVCSQLEEYITDICEDLDIMVEIVVFNNGDNLCKALCDGEKFTLLFLDIELANRNGVEIGGYIRDVLHNNDIQIAYISGMESYAMQLFEIRPINFIIKPVSYEKIEQVVLKTISLMNTMSRRFVYKQKHDVYYVEYHDILYFKSSNRKIQIIKQDGVEEFYGRLDKIYKELPSNKFLYIHKSYVVHTSYIKHYEYESVTMVTGEKLPIAQSRRKLVRMAQLEFGLGGGK